MRATKITLTQQILNKVNSKQEFTHKLTDNNNRYIVSIKNLYTGTNPSLYFNMIIDIQDIINSNSYDSIGTWISSDGLFYVDCNIHITNLKIALMTAKAFNQMAIYDSLKNEVINLK